MSKIEWDKRGERIYEVGVDRGVLYLGNDSGIGWNGLITVDHDLEQSTKAYFFEGKRFINYPIDNTFIRKIKAYMYPDEFSEYFGYKELDDGLVFPGQTKSRFSFCYRSMSGDDTLGEPTEYKIHIFYNLSATFDDVLYDTIENAEVTEFGWEFSGLPSDVDGYDSSAYIIVDSRYFNSSNLHQLENILYGTETTEPRLPSLESLLEMIDSDFTIVIIDHGDGSWSAEGPTELITMSDPTTFQIDEINAVYLDPETYTAEST